jgi:hypothetical protein
VIAASLYEHGIYIESHLDYAPERTSNHYLADLVGLLHIAVVLPDSPGSNRWAALAIQEITSEMERTVMEDGASYEGSTGYHRLISEMFLHGMLAGLRLPLSRREELVDMRRSRRRSPTVDPQAWAFDPTSAAIFPDWFYDRLRSMVQLTQHLTKPNGLVPQFGDQDSGRFLKFDWPTVRDSHEFVEEPRDHRHLSALFDTLLGVNAPGTSSFPIDKEIGSVPLIRARYAKDPTSSRAVQFSGPEDESVWYPNGGHFIAHTGPFWLAVRCERKLHKAPTGHRHNDQLSFELNVYGVDFIADPGTGSYTSNTNLRNQLRATEAHSTVSVQGSEQRQIPSKADDLFELQGDSDAKPTSLGPQVFSAVHTWSDSVHHRTFDFDLARLTISDRVEGRKPWTSHLVLAPGVVVTRESDSDVIYLRHGSTSLSVTVVTDNVEVHIDQIPFSPRFGQTLLVSRLILTPPAGTCVVSIQLLDNL